MQCPACGADVPEGDLFCEECGTRLGAAPVQSAAASPGCACGASAGEVDEDGFCLRCGLRMRKLAAMDHMEQVLSATFAVVSDRGLKHDRNEDRFAAAEIGGVSVLVVCDGVSSTSQSEIASAAVSQGMLESLTKAFEADPYSDPEAALRQAIADGSANLVAQSAQADKENPPSTTAVAALVVGDEAVIGWLGDSRAYWIGASSAQALTRDHSWMNRAITEEGMSPAEAARSPQAHAITRWLGADSTDIPDPSIVHHSIRTPGMLLLCTDGLWNYASTDEAMAEVVAEISPPDADVVELARALIKFANDRGGHDNITVAALRFV